MSLDCPSIPVSVALVEMNMNEGNTGGIFPCVYNQRGEAGTTLLNEQTQKRLPLLGLLVLFMLPLESQKVRYAWETYLDISILGEKISLKMAAK